MRKTQGWSFVVLPLALATGAGAQEAPLAAPDLPGWMAGCWIAEHGEGRQSEECWTSPRGDMMLGSGHMIADGKTVSFEHMRIVRSEEGLVFIAQPGGAPGTSFALEPEGLTRLPHVSFVNTAHDYPQRVTYWLANDRLEAEIAMLDGSQPMRWTFTRVARDGEE